VSGLFIEFYLDEDVSVLVAELLRARGFTALTTRQAGRRASTDREQLEYATSQSKVLLTHSRADFELLARECYASRRSHSGIVIAVRRPPQEIVRRLLVILNAITADEMCDRIVYV
jgi:predicted nuclease of predicted toxin-antitoxin system